MVNHLFLFNSVILDYQRTTKQAKPSTPMECLRQWRNWIRPLVMGLYGLLLCVALPLIIADFQLTGTRSHFQAWFIGGMFVLMAVPISLWGILQHLTHYTQPHLQRCIIRYDLCKKLIFVDCVCKLPYTN